MLIYRDAARPADTEAVWSRARRRLAGPVDQETATDLLIEIGMLESALADALHPLQDEIGPEASALRAMSEAAGRLFVRPEEPGRVALQEALEQARRFSWPAQVVLKIPEGYAWYALHPGGYADAARRLAEAERPRSVTVLGLRSIGASLSAVVAATLAQLGVAVWSLTARPRGEPFDRRLRLSEALEAKLKAQPAGGLFVVVDEGPGMSGSSFAGAAERLGELGIEDKRIVLMPANAVDGSAFASARAAARWRRHTRYPALSGLALTPRLEGARDLSGGLWREVVPLRAAKPPVAAQFERIKRLDGDGRLHRFVGYGPFGREVAARLQAAATAGFTPPVAELADGFLSQAWRHSAPSRARDLDGATIERASDYLRWIARERRTGAAADLAPLEVMIRRNATLAFGEDARLRVLDRLVLPQAEAVVCDGRLLPQEWLRTPDGLMKVDGAEHGDDHFLPGPTDPTWDVAGFAVEWGLTDAAAGELAKQVGGSQMRSRLLFHLTAYTAFRLGVTTFAAGGASRPDRAGLMAQAARYRGLLSRSLDRLNAS